MSAILVQTRTFRQKMKGAFFPTAFALFLSACTNMSFFGNAVTDSLRSEAYASSEYYINKAAQSSAETQQSYRLLAIRQLLQENKAVEAQNVLDDLNFKELNEAQQIEYRLVSAQLAAVQRHNEQALSLLRKLPQSQLSQVQQYRVYQIQASVAENRNDPIAVVRARALMNSYITDNRQRQENNDRIWETLRQANRSVLERASISPSEMELAGWISLTKLYRQYMAAPLEFPTVLNSWQQRYPNHSAVYALPSELQRLVNFQQTQLTSVALLLPLSGEQKVLGEIIKKGFDDAKGKETAFVKVYDTNKVSIAELVSQAKAENIHTLVGPLFKSRVDEMMLQADGSMNILALNATPNARNIPGLCYYGLSPEAEARSGAERLFNDNFEQAIVIAPQGDFGQRSAEAFTQRWRQLTRRDADVRYYYQPTEAVANLINVKLSNKTGIYLLGNANQLMELKQAFAQSSLSEFDGLYTSSRSNSPNNGLDFRLAMQGVKFSEIPLLSDSESESYRMANYLAERDFSLMRLYAMGADAWLIVNKFNEFSQIPGYKVSGLTGILSAGKNCNIEREMTWLQYQDGAIVPAN